MRPVATMADGSDSIIRRSKGKSSPKRTAQQSNIALGHNHSRSVDMATDAGPRISTRSQLKSNGSASRGASLGTANSPGR
mmetsp:Transcript_28296/g.63198  ORF Transcript_28296/g.63198 Transcript_28296/m.63198 type:complete len:80 (-) Transcript_28296:259-498(-)